MMSFEILTDTSCNLNEDQIRDFRLHITPLTFFVDGKEYTSYLDGHLNDVKQFYTMMREGKVITTSLPPLEITEDKVRELLDSGSDVLYIGFSSGLSGTYASTATLLDRLAKEYPDCKIYHIDTLAASAGEGLLIRYAAKLRDEGKSIEEVYDWLEANRLNLAHWFTVDDLMFLMRGGRVSKASAIAGTMLGIKPVLHVDDSGRLVVMSKARGRRKALKALVDRMESSVVQPASELPVFIAHGDCYEDAKVVADDINQRMGITDFTINYIDPVIGAHAGPGTVALFFLAEHR